MYVTLRLPPQAGEERIFLPTTSNPDSPGLGRGKVQTQNQGWWWCWCWYDRDSLERIFLKYGTVTGVVISEKNGGSALVEFQDIAATKMAV